MAEKKEKTKNEKSSETTVSSSENDKTENSKLKTKNEVAEMKETLQRLQAEFENYKKRVENEKANFIKHSCSSIILEILPVLDSFEFALKSKGSEKDFVKGMEMIYSQFFSILESKGLRPIEAEGKKFNPYVHEALMQQESDKEEGIIVEEFQKGYMLGEQVLRHSKVKVSKGALNKVQGPQ